MRFEPPSNVNYIHHNQITSYNSNYSHQNGIKQKRENFRKQIRRQQLEQLFADKRKVLIQQLTKQQLQNQQNQDYFQQNIGKQSNLGDILSKIQKRMNLMIDLTNLANILTQENFYKGYLTNKDTDNNQQEIEQLCLRIIYMLIKNIFPDLTQNKQFKKQYNTFLRKTLLTAIANLLADKKCPNHKVYPLISQFLQNYYGSVQIWGKDQQILQVGWMLGNLFSKNLLEGVQIYQTCLIKLLQWMQQFLQIHEINILRIIYPSLIKFFKNVDKVYKSDQLIIQHFKSERLALIQLTIQKNFQVQIVKNLQSSLLFIEYNKNYLKYLSNQTIQKLISQSIKLLNTQSKKVVQTIVRILIYTYNLIQNSQDQFIKYLLPIVNYLCWQSIHSKVQILKLINTLCNRQHFIYQFLKLGIQNTLAKFMRDLSHNDLQIEIIIITHKIYETTKQGQKILREIANFINIEGEVGNYALILFDTLKINYIMDYENRI